MGTDVPVAVRLEGALGEEVRAFAETEAGWQLVDVDAGLPPVLVLAGAPVEGTPWALVVDGAPTADLVRTTLQAGAVDVIGWPQDRVRLLDLPDRLRPSRTGRGARLITVTGAAGGTGTSTVALGLGALLAASGRRTTVVGGDDLLRLAGLPPWEGPGALDVAALVPSAVADEVRVLSRAVPGAGGLRVLGGGAVTTGEGWPGDVVVVDGGAAGMGRPDLVCARPDAHLPVAAGRGCPVLVVGDGPLPSAAVRRILGRRAAGRVTWSTRVARAGAAGRVPSGLPGAWLRQLGEVLPLLGGRPAGAGGWR